MAISPISEDDIQKKAKAFEESENKRAYQERTERINHFVVLNEQMIDNILISRQNKGLKPPYEVEFIIWSLNLKGEIYHFNYRHLLKICKEFNIDPNDENPEIEEQYCISNLDELKYVFDKISETYKKIGWLPGLLIDTPLNSYGYGYVDDDSTYGHSYTFFLETLESLKERRERENILKQENIEKENKRQVLIAKKKIEDLRLENIRREEFERENIKWNISAGAKQGVLSGGILGFVSGFVSCLVQIEKHGSLNWDFFSLAILGVIIGAVIGIIKGANTRNKRFESYL